MNSQGADPVQSKADRGEAEVQREAKAGDGGVPEGGTDSTGAAGTQYSKYYSKYWSIASIGVIFQVLEMEEFQREAQIRQVQQALNTPSITPSIGVLQVLE